jgi:hypothetical protein
MLVDNIAKEYQKNLFPGKQADTPWRDTERYKRHHLAFPFFPFRTLHPRELNTMDISGASETIDKNSPLFPGNTQINLSFHRRQQNTLINFIYPYNLNTELGSQANTLDQGQRDEALTFKVPNPAAGAAAVPVLNVFDEDGNEIAPAQQPQPPATINSTIVNVTVNIRSIYLQVLKIFVKISKDIIIKMFFCKIGKHSIIFYAQVLRIKYKSVSPERPLTVVFTSLRMQVTPIQRVSLHTYDLSWESTNRPLAVFISFVR